MKRYLSVIWYITRIRTARGSIQRRYHSHVDSRLGINRQIPSSSPDRILLYTPEFSGGIRDYGTDIVSQGTVDI